MRDRRRLAAAVWFLLAFLVWNVRFDHGVRLAASSYIQKRAEYVAGRGPAIEMAPAMRDGIRASAGAASLLALPAVLVAAALSASIAAARRQPPGPG